jgi:hypothetical protein
MMRPGPIRRHVHLYLALDVDHGVVDCRFCRSKRLGEVGDTPLVPITETPSNSQDDISASKISN